MFWNMLFNLLLSGFIKGRLCISIYPSVSVVELIVVNEIVQKLFVTILYRSFSVGVNIAAKVLFL